MTILAILAFVLGNLPLIAAVIGHRRDRRRQAVADDIARIEAGFTSWTDPTPPTPLRAIAWPQRQTPTDVAAAYEPVPWTDPDWAVNELAVIVAAVRMYDEMKPLEVMAA